MNRSFIILQQRCPRVFFRSPQMWRMNAAIRHILRIEIKYPFISFTQSGWATMPTGAIPISKNNNPDNNS
jgi:hypothetical protein